MPGTGSATYVLGPLLVAALLGAVILVARWALGHRTSPAEDRAEYGLLTPLAEAVTIDDLGSLQDALFDAGIRCTLAEVGGGYHLLVWPRDLDRARGLLRQVRDSS